MNNSFSMEKPFMFKTQIPSVIHTKSNEISYNEKYHYNMAKRITDYK